MSKALAIAVALLCLTTSAVAQTSEDRATRISQEVMSPFCPGLTLYECSSQASVDLRAEIESWAAQGLTDQEIYDRLEAEYGAVVVSSGRSWFLFILPAIALAGGLVFAFFVARRWKPGTDNTKPHSGTGSPTAEDHRRVEAELGQMRDQRWGPGR